MIALLGAIGGITGGIAGFLSGSILGEAVVDRLTVFYQWVLPLPIDVVDLIPDTAWQVGGPLGAIIGAVYGAVTLAWLGAAYPWELLYAGDPLWPITVALGHVVSAVVIGAAYTVVMIGAERARLLASGARVPSRREVAALQPIIADCAARLGMGSAAPILLMVDDLEVARATAAARHLVVSTRLLRECRDDDGRLSAVVTRALVHWRDGHTVAAIWTKGIALPLFILYEVAARLTAATTNTRARPMTFVVRVLLWPFVITTRYVVAPAQRRYWHRCEYAVDAITARAGFAGGLRAAIEAESTAAPEPGGDHWDRAVTAMPPAELRLQAIEAQGAGGYDRV